MALTPRPPTGAAATPASTPTPATPTGVKPEQDETADLALPHERDESTAATAATTDPVIAQAKRDLDAGMVDTDMRATPGIDAARRERLVPGPGGKPPASR